MGHLDFDFAFQEDYKLPLIETKLIDLKKSDYSIVK